MRKFLLATMAILWLLTGLGGKLVAQENIAVWKFPATGGATTSINADCVSDLIQSSDCELNVLTEEWSVIATDLNNANTALCDDGSGTDQTKGLRMVNTGGNFETASIVFKISTSAFANIHLSYDHRIAAGSLGGYATETWSYSTNGRTFTDMSPIEGGTTAYATETVDFSSVSALNGMSSVWFKLTVSGATVNNAATIIDNVVFTGSPMTCLTPVNVTAVADDSPTEAVVSWDAQGDNQTSYSVVYYEGALGTAPLNSMVNQNYNAVVDATSPQTITGLAENTTYYFYVRANCGDDDASMWSSPVIVTTPTRCTISGLVARNIQGTTATLSWNTDAQGAKVRVFAEATDNPWETEGFVFEGTTTDTFINVNSNSIDYSTTYYAYVSSVCTEHNISTPAFVTFTTGCAPIDTYPQEYSFEDVTGSYAIPNCWERIVAYTSGSAAYPYVYDYSYYAHGGSKSLYMYTSTYYDAPENIIALPPMRNLNTLQIKLWAKASYTIPQEFQIGYIRNDEFISLKSITLTTTYQQFTAYLNSVPDDAEMIAIRAYHSTSSITVYVDDIVVDLLPNCVTPDELHASNLTATSATIAWTDVLPATAWQYQVGNGDTINAVENPIVLNDLTPNTQYSIRVRTVCGEEEYTEWAALTFSTPCEAINTFPWSEDFADLTSGIPECWDNSEGTTTDNSYRWNYYATGHAGAGLRFNSFSNSSGNTNMLKTPTLDLSSVASAKLEFWYKNPTGGDFSVYVSTDGGSTYTGNVIASNLTSVASWTKGSYDITNYCQNSNVVIVFKATSNWGSGDAYIYLDEISVVETSSDNTILSYAASTAQGDAICSVDNDAHSISVVLRWGYEAGTAISQTIVLNDENATIKQFVDTAFVDLPASFTWGMTSSDTTVTYKVIAENRNEQIYTAHVSVESCGTPNGLTAQQTTSTNVNLSWTPIEGTSAWNFYCSTTQLSDSELETLSEYTTLDAASTSYTVTSETTYYWYVRTDCGGEHSRWMSSSFTSWEECLVPTNVAATPINTNDIAISWAVQDNLPLAEGLFTDDFERDAINGGQFQYTNDATYPWIITGDASHSGSFSMKSGNGGVGNTTSSITYTVNYPAAGTISFYGRVSSEQNNASYDWDNGRFYIDDVRQGSVIINSDSFSYFTYNVTAGTHTFKWEYKKDGSVNTNDDCFYVDDITMQGLVPGGNSSVVIYRNDELLATVPAITTSYTDTSLVSGSYCYKVKTICSENNESAFSEDVCTEINDCYAVRNLSANDVTENSVVLRWTRGTTESAWNIRVNGAEPIALTQTSNGMSVRGDTISYTLTGLEALTNYTVAVQTNCGSSLGQVWETVDFTTERTPATLPYAYGFEDDAENANWVLENGSQTNKWYIGTASNHGGENGLYISNDEGVTNAYSNVTTYVYAYRPIRIDRTSDYEVSFDWNAYGYLTYDLLRAFLVPTSVTLTAGNANGMTTYTNTTPTGWIDIANPTGKLNVASGWQHSEKTMSIEAGSYNLVFFWKNYTYTSGSQPPATVDNISIARLACPAVGNIAVNNITETSAEITWNERGDATEWGVVLSETALTAQQLESAVPQVVTSRSYQAAELTSNTAYYVYVRANCSDDEQSDWGSISFRTQCGPWTIPFTETFSDYSATTYSTAGIVPYCWDTVYNGTSAAYAPHVSNSTAYAPMSGADVNYLFVIAAPSTSTNYTNYGDNNIVIMPKVEGGYAGKAVSFEARTSNTANAVVKLGYMNGDNFVDLEDVAFETSTISFSTVISNAVPEESSLALKFSALASASSVVYYGIDNVTVREVSTDNTILSYAATTAQGDAFCSVDNEAHTISVVLRSGYNATAIMQTVVLGDEHSTIKQLYGENYIDFPPRFTWYMTGADTTVIYRVIAENGDIQNYTSHISVETCAAPINLASVQTSITNVNLSWEAVGGTTAWNFFCSTTELTASELNASAYTTVNEPTTSYTVEGETTYYWYVRTDCNGDNSEWISGSFTTWENCVPPANITTELVNNNDIVLTWDIQDNLPVEETILTDGFERNDVNGGTFNYTNSTGNLAWSIVSSEHHSGSNCLKSASGNHSSTSQISMAVNISESSPFSFWYKVSSESNYDKFSFAIDGTNVVSNISGEVPWTQYSTTLSAGNHTLTWKYYKDVNGEDGSDCVWIDDISLQTMAVNSTVVVYRNDEQLITLPASTTSYTDAELDAGDYCYKLKTICRTDSESAFSESVCQAVNECYAVANLSVGSITTDSATISWTRGSDETAWNIRINDAEPFAINETSEGVTVENNAISYVLAGLDAMTNYTVAVQTDCGDMLGLTWTSIRFMTQRVPATLPYTCNFEESLANNGWVLANGNQTNKWYIGAAENNGGENGLYISNDGGETNAYSNTTSYVYAYRTITVENESEYTVSFDWKANGYSTYDLLRAFLVPTSVTLTAGNANGMTSYTNTTPNNWIDVANPQGKLNLQTEWQHSENTIDLEAGSYNLVFFWKNYPYSYSSDYTQQPPAAIDNVSVIEVACPRVNNLAVNNETITGTTAAISWTETGTASEWTVVVSETALSDSELASAEAATVTEQSYNATGLTPETFYNVYVRANCSAEESSNWAHVTFSTTAACPVPTDILISATGNSASVRWTGYSATEWEVVCSATELDDPATGTVQNATAASYTLTGLSPLTTYYVYVRAICDGVDYSTWTDATFTTGCTAIATLPWEEDFENGIDCWTVLDGDGDYYEWELTASTGAHSNSYYITSASYDNDEGPLTPNNWLISPAIDLTAQTGTIKLSYFVKGQDSIWYAEHYKVRISTTNTDTASFSTILLDETIPQKNWNERTIDLSRFIGETIYIAFVHCDITDMFMIDIDDVSVFVDNSIDAAITEITAPTHVNGQTWTCALTAAEQIKVKILNNGGAAISNFEVSYSVNGGAPVTETVTETINPAQTYEYTFAEPADLSAVGSYTITANVVYITDDENASNDTASMNITNGDGTIRIHAFTDSGSGQSWTVTNTETDEVVAESASAWRWNIEVNDYVCVDASQCYRIAVNDANGMSGDETFVEILYNGTRVAGSTEGGSFTGPSLVAERFAPQCQSAENDIITFSVPDMLSVNIDTVDHTVDAVIAYSSDENLASIVPTITVSESAQITRVGNATYTAGLPRDFTSPVVFTVRAENGETQPWTVTVTRAEAASSEKDILAFSFSGQVGASIIDAEAHTVTAFADYNIDLATPIAPTIEISHLATITPASGTQQTFTDTVDYTVMAEDSTTQVWRVSITQDPQTLASMPYSCNFEDAAENANWILNNGTQSNKWYVGEVANNGGANGLYISNDEGVSNNYGGSISFVYAYRQINIEESGNYDFSFDWKANGESNYDLLRAFLVPAPTTALAAGNANGMTTYTNTTPTGWIDVANPTGKLNLATEWQHSDATVRIDSIGAYNFVFFWKNDGSVYNQTPAAVDNISIERSVFTVRTSHTGLGVITPEGETQVNDGGQFTLTITTFDGFVLESLMVDGVNYADSLVDGVLTFTVDHDYDIVANFDVTHTILAMAEVGGTITPEGEVAVSNGESKRFNVAANPGYLISSVVVDDTTDVLTSTRSNFSYTFTNVREDHTINAAFTRAEDHIIIATAGVGGTIDPSGNVTVLYNDSQTFRIVPDEGYSLSRVMVDTVFNVTSQIVDSTYTFAGVISNHSIDAEFTPNSYNLTVHYIYADSTEAANDYTGTFVFGTEYSVPSPEIIGYTADIDTVAGTMIAQDVVVYVTYTPTNYNLTIHYVYADQTEARPDYTAQVAYGAEYLVESPVIECYTANTPVVEGTMPAEDHVVTVTYTVDTYTLTIHYVYADNTAISDSVMQVACGTTYSVESPVIDGYTADPAVVEGTMPAENHEVTVTYNEIVTHTLTIHYVYAETNAQAADDHTEILAEGAAYSVPSPVIDGYTADQTVVAGTMGTADITVTVTYTENAPVTHTLTIHYVYAETNAQAAADYTATLAAGESYSVASPVIEGYTADQATVAGTMPAQDVEVTVRYTANPVNTYTITATAGNGGTINPLGTVTVNEGGDQAFTITADAGYRIASVLVDGADAISELVNNVYTFVNVTANHTIAVTFAPVSSTTYTIIATAGANGTITPNGVITVNEGATQTFRITPNNGYRIATVMVDDVNVINDVVDFEYTFYNVTADHRINVTFTNGDAVDEYTAGSMSVYPNPNNGMFSIEFANINGDATYQLIDARGAVVETRDINVMNGDTMNFDYNLRPGAYFVRIITTDRVYVEQIVVE
jgi:hypothetical protein